MGRVCGTYRGRGEVHVTVGWENLTNRSLGRPRHRWEYNIRMHLKEMVGRAWTGLMRQSTE